MPVAEHSIHYFEIVTPDVEAARDLYATAYSWPFEQKQRAELGNAFVAALPDGSRCGIRAPLHEQEKPIVRIYLRVRDLDAAVASVSQHGAVIALEPTEIPGHGRIAIYRHGGIEQGLWQLP